VLGASDWDAPAPVAGWRARDVVRHLTDWLPALLAGGAGIELSTGISVDDDPAAAWLAHAAAVQALLDDPGTADRPATLAVGVDSHHADGSGILNRCATG
jgi:hypothetical protein